MTTELQRVFLAYAGGTDDPDGCWEWIGRRTPNGYGQLTILKHHFHAHRFAFEAFVAPIPTGLQIDHTCHRPEECAGGHSCPHRRCVNPAHLVAVSQRQNVLRGGGHTALNAAKTHCPANHPYDSENTYVDKNGWRYCRICTRARRATNEEGAVGISHGAFATTH